MAVAQAIATFTRLGHDVAVPITESASYDLIVDCDDGLKRVQVRYTSCHRGQVDLRRIHSNGTGYVVKKTKPDAYDWLYVLNERGEEFLLKKCLHARRSWTTDHASLLTPPIQLGVATTVVARAPPARTAKRVSRPPPPIRSDSGVEPSEPRRSQLS